MATNGTERCEPIKQKTVSDESPVHSSHMTLQARDLVIMPSFAPHAKRWQELQPSHVVQNEGTRDKYLISPKNGLS